MEKSKVITSHLGSSRISQFNSARNSGGDMGTSRTDQGLARQNLGILKYPSSKPAKMEINSGKPLVLVSPYAIKCHKTDETPYGVRETEAMLGQDANKLHGRQSLPRRPLLDQEVSLSPNMDIVRKHKKTHFETHGLVFT